MAGSVDFFYGPGSRYSYLASTQIAQLEADTGCRVRWRSLYSGDLFAARGLDPFRGEPVSGQYTWSHRRFDAECWADFYGVPFREPDDVEADWRLLALAATAADRMGAVQAFSRKLLDAVFVHGTSPLDAQACRRLAATVGLDPTTFAAMLEAPETAAAHAATIAEALAASVFGVPSFVTGGQVFWGNDRLPIVRHMVLKAKEGGGGTAEPGGAPGAWTGGPPADR